MGAYHNALREEGSRSDLMAALETAWGEGEDLKHDIERHIQITTDQAQEGEHLRQLLRGRDKFIVDKGLWLEFVGSLPRRSPNVRL